MSYLGTDVMAVACILGGAGAGIAGTVALAEADRPVAMAEPCFVEAVEAGPAVVLSIEGDGPAAAPRVVVRSKHREAHPRPHCVHVAALPDVEAIRRDVRREMERAQEEMMRAWVEMDRARARAVRADDERMRARAERVQGARLERAREDGGL